MRSFSASCLRTDPSDVYRDMQQRVDTFVVLDVRSSEAYAQAMCGAICHTEVNAATAALPHDKLLVVYCWGPEVGNGRPRPLCS